MPHVIPQTPSIFYTHKLRRRRPGLLNFKILFETFNNEVRHGTEQLKALNICPRIRTRIIVRFWETAHFPLP